MLAVVCLSSRYATGQEQAVEEDLPINFVTIADAHTLTGNLRYLPKIVQEINALPIQPDFVMALGDNVSGGEEHNVLQDAIDFEACYSQVKSPRYYVIGNHECIPVEVYKLLTWPQLLGAWKMESRWYSFDVRQFHICVLDGWSALAGKRFADVFDEQKKWFVNDLASTRKKTIVFIHQAVGFQREDCPEWIRTDNRKFWPPGSFFEKTIEANRGKIVGVFEGHKHKALWKRQNGVVYHQLGAAHMNGGQFAQVFIDAASGDFYVEAHPESKGQDEIFGVQQSYGKREVMEKCRQLQRSRVVAP